MPSTKLTKKDYKMKVIELPCYGIKVTLDGNRGTIYSDLIEPDRIGRLDFYH